MQFVGKVFSSVSEFYKDINPATLSGAIDVLVVKDDAGHLCCSPFHVRFGKLQLLRPQEKAVEIRINGTPVEGIQMKVGEAGESFFVLPAERGSIPEELLTSPLAKPVLGDLSAAMEDLSLSPSKPCARALSDGALSDDDLLLAYDFAAESVGEGRGIRRTKHLSIVSPSPPAPVPLPAASLPQRYSWMWGDLPTPTPKLSSGREYDGDGPLVVEGQGTGVKVTETLGALSTADVGDESENLTVQPAIAAVAATAFTEVTSPNAPGPLPNGDNNFRDDVDIFELVTKPDFIKQNYDLFINHQGGATPATEATTEAVATAKATPAAATSGVDVSLHRLPSHLAVLTISESDGGLIETVKNKMIEMDWNAFIDDPSSSMTDLSQGSKEIRTIILIDDAIIFPGNIGYALLMGKFLFNQIISFKVLSKRFPWILPVEKREGALNMGTFAEAASAGSDLLKGLSSSGTLALAGEDKSVNISPNVVLTNIATDDTTVTRNNGVEGNTSVNSTATLTVTSATEVSPVSATTAPTSSWRWWSRSVVSSTVTSTDVANTGTTTEAAEFIQSTVDPSLSITPLDVACQTPLPPSPSSSPISSGNSPCRSEDLCYKKSLRLPHELLNTLPLNEGPNSISFTVTTSLQGTATCTARIFLWPSTSRIIISDIDGTITKSDALGHIFTMVGKDWTHSDIASLYTKILRNGYRFLYLSSRSLGQANSTRGYLKGVEQNKFQLPEGPVIVSPDRLFTAFRKEVVLGNPQEFKTACLRDLQLLFQDCSGAVLAAGGEERERENPFYAGFGNRTTDVASYLAIGIPPQRIFVVKPSGQINIEPLSDYYSGSYTQLIGLVDSIFPPLHPTQPPSRVGEEPYNEFWYWRRPLSIAPLLSQAPTDGNSNSDPINSIISAVHSQVADRATPPFFPEDPILDEDGEVEEGLVPAFYI